MSFEETRGRVAALLCLGLALTPFVAEGKRIETPYSSAGVPADALVGKVQRTVMQDSGRLLRQFRDLHEGTQVGRVEATLAGAIGIELLTLGFGVELGVDGTEVVGIFRNGPGPTLHYRVDTGADISRAAQAHRCGPDVQAAWALGLARALSQLRAEWAGTFVLVAQPSRRISGDGPALRGAGQLDPSRLPRPDYVVALLAAATPIGSVLRVQGLRRRGSSEVEMAVSRAGAYDELANAEAATELAATTASRYAPLENVPFAYMLVGLAEPSLAAETTIELEGAGAREVPVGGEPSPHLDLAAITLGVKIAAVAVLELGRSPLAVEARKGNGLGWTDHHY
jgi:hypothetical protein